MEPKNAPPEELRDRVIRAVQQVLGNQDLNVNVTFAPADSNEIRILASSGEWQCMFSVPMFESDEGIVGRIHQALLAARTRPGSDAQDAAARRAKADEPDQ